MAYNSNVSIEMRGIQGGEICSNQFEYHAEEAVSGSYADLFLTEWRANVWGALQPLLSTHYTLLQITCETIDTFGGGAIHETYIEDVVETGGVAGEVMPPNVTARLVKVVNNNTIQPPEATHFRNGFCGFSGVPEGSQDNGLLTAAARLGFASVAAGLQEVQITIGATPYTWTLGLERGELDPSKVLVSTVLVSGRLGTRNTRKR